MKTTLFKSIILIFALGFCSFTHALKDQEKKYNYTVKITGVTDKVSYKSMSNILMDLFDVTPAFNDATDVITISNTYWVSETKISSKLAKAGYSLQEYSYVLIVEPVDGSTK